ncbi:hypothetical protein OG792_01885 [Micromonospora sp. NBC_01699]|uniref:hypothetical protein n=1 Tax=Micromonospora sp. NBC_01699 TaxID=2975984 RepID=UPI002E2E866B|nr:hypothetical protein [Micromonospora sp. NBC_01699]
MTHHKSARSESGRADTGPAGDKRDKRKDAGRDWADEAAQARASDDPRRVTPHDPTGVPSTGDRR